MAFVKSISFPFRIGPAGVVASTDADTIRESIIQIIGVRRDERPMRPNYGCDVSKYLFEQDSAILAESIISEVQAALTQNEPRIFVKSITVTREDENEEVIVVTLTYIIVATRQEQTLQVTL